jgi:class 3 adenylate cyclase
LAFRADRTPSHEALVLIFDLEGFSSFCGQPGAEAHVPALLNRVFGCIELVLNGSELFWVPKSKRRPAQALPPPDHQKFLGDGGLYLWLLGSHSSIGQQELVTLMNRLWTLRRHFPEVMRGCASEIPMASLPTAIRIGLARGAVYVLARADSDETEYAGYCINLASRLQGYCRDLGFIASARVGLPEQLAKTHKYKRVVATRLRGLPREVVFVDSPEYAALDRSVRSELFQPLEPPRGRRRGA